jgi:hypothetical protein
LAIQKNFVVKNGLEVDENTLYVDSDANKVGIGTIFPDVELRVIGSIGCTDFSATRNLRASGISTFNQVQFTGANVTIGDTTGAPGQYLRSTGSGVEWASFPTTVRAQQTFIATDNQTTFTYAYNIGFLDVYINGVKLRGDGASDISDYIANNGVNFSVNQECFDGDIVEVAAYNPAAVGGGNTGILGVTIQEEGVIVGNPNGVNSINFIGVAITAVGSGAGVTVYGTGGGGSGSLTVRDKNNIVSAGTSDIDFTGNSATVFTSSEGVTVEINSGINTVGTSTFNDVRILGILTAAQYSGDGSGLTNITSTGTGVEIQNDGASVGTAATISFVEGFTIEPISAGVVTVRTAYAWSGTAAGISTTANVSISGLTALTNASVSGVSTFGGIIEASSGENKIPSLYANLAALPSAASYHGMFAHVHSEGKGYFAHAGNWLELVNRDTGGNVSISGIITASSFSGSGAGLTSLPSGQLTGALPAIDGSALTGISGGGSGGGKFSDQQTNAGIHTTSSHVGFGTTNPITSIQVNNVYGIETGSGSFTASAGIAYTANTYTSTDFVNSEYTLFFQHSSGIQSQKILVMDNDSTAYSQEYAIMYSSDLLVSVGATVKSGNVELWWTPESGVNGIVTYRFTRETMI